MKKIIAINTSPRKLWNTGTLVREAARGAQSEGAEVTVIDLYRLAPFSGCVSCFGCKLPGQEGICVCQDGLAQVLQEIRAADGLIVGTPNYLGDASAGFRALYERLIFQSITYQTQNRSCNQRRIPVLFVMTSNAPQEMYTPELYGRVVSNYQQTLNTFVGPTKVLISADTLQVKDYSKYNWTLFDAASKMARHETVFPLEMQEAFSLGARMAAAPWDGED